VLPRELTTPRSAAIAGILFAVLLGTSLVLLWLSMPDRAENAGEWLSDPTRRRTVRWALNLVPFAGIAFLWFIGVVRDRIGALEDQVFPTVFLGSGLLFLASLFAAPGWPAAWSRATQRRRRVPTSGPSARPPRTPP
jgi:hypothetical protein